MIYKAAIDYAREKNDGEIVELLTKGPNRRMKNLIERNKTLHLKVQRLLRATHLSKNEGRSHPSESQNETGEAIGDLQEELKKLKKYLSALNTKTEEIEIVDINEFEEVSVIGEGGTSSVKEVIKRERYAKKELKELSHEKRQRFLAECETLSKLHHPCIIDIVGVNFGDGDHPPSIILSLEPKSLESAISNKELENDDKNRITVEIVLGMRYIHKRNFMHRDLKPTNILLSKNNEVRISDFGLAKYDDISCSQTKGVGTLRFMAPELCEDGEVSTKYTNKVDVYSFGITLMYIITERYPPFSMRNVVLGIVPTIPATVVGWVSSLIVRCLSPESEKRPSFDEIFEELKSHNFDLFSEESENQLTSKQRSMKQAIESRVLEIEAFEYQHQ